MSEPARSHAPLILTLAMDERSFTRLDGLRRTHFPAALNHIPAHLTLFHKLPGDRLEEIAARLGELARTQPPLELHATGVRLLGRGVAYQLDPGKLSSLRRKLAADWEAWLTPQDRQGFRPHVTVQNKVTPAAAKALHAELSASFQRFPIDGTGLLLWRYLGGPWKLELSVPFGGRHDG